MLEFVRWLQGFVQFCIIGKFPERFINIVTKNRLSIWDCNRKDGMMNARMYVRDYKKIRKLAKNSSVRLKVVNRFGLPFYIKKYKCRIGVLIGVFVFAMTIYVMSCFVWSIEIVGLETISYSQLMSALEQNGLSIGTFKPTASFPAISRKTMLDIEEIGWMSINVNGSHASVELKEKAKSPHVEDYHTPANVKAKRDGVILSINTKQGEAYFEQGSAVVKDQLLVSAVVEDKLNRVRLVRADAQVIARTTYNKRFAVQKDYSIVSFDAPKTKRTLNMFSLSIPFDFDFTDEKNSLSRFATDSAELFDTALPLSITTETIYNKETDNVDLNKQQSQNILRNQALIYEALELSNCIVTDKELSFSEDNSCYFLDVTYTCEEDIAYKQDIDAKDITISHEIPERKSDSQ